MGSNPGPAWPVAALVSLSKTLNHNCFVLRSCRAVGPVCCVMHVKEPRTLIVKGLAPVFLDSCLEQPSRVDMCVLQIFCIIIINEWFCLKCSHYRENINKYEHIKRVARQQLFAPKVQVFSVKLVNPFIQNIPISYTPLWADCWLPNVHVYLDSKRVSILSLANITNVVPSLQCISWFKESKHTQFSQHYQCCTFPSMYILIQRE